MSNNFQQRIEEEGKKFDKERVQAPGDPIAGTSQETPESFQTTTPISKEDEGGKLDKDRNEAASSDHVDGTVGEMPESIQTEKSATTEAVGEKFDKDRKEAAPRDPLDANAPATTGTIQLAKSVLTEEAREMVDKDRKEAAPPDPIDGTAQEKTATMETAKSIEIEVPMEEKTVPGKASTPKAPTVYDSSVKDDVSEKTTLSAPSPTTENTSILPSNPIKTYNQNEQMGLELEKAILDSRRNMENRIEGLRTQAELQAPLDTVDDVGNEIGLRSVPVPPEDDAMSPKKVDELAISIPPAEESIPAASDDSLVVPTVSLSALSQTPSIPSPQPTNNRPRTRSSPNDEPLDTVGKLPTTQSNPRLGPPGDNNGPVTRSSPNKESNEVRATVAQESFTYPEGYLDGLVGLTRTRKVEFHRYQKRGSNKCTQEYLDHAYDIVYDFRKCDIRTLHVIKKKEDEADSDEDNSHKLGPSDQAMKIVVKPEINTGPLTESEYVLVTGFPPAANEMAYCEKDCLECIHGDGPVDIGCDFAAVDKMVLSNLTRASFQYTDYLLLLYGFKGFLDQWLTLDILQFYQCWVSRSIGSYPENIFLLPMDYFQANIDDIFEHYWSGHDPPFKKSFMKRMWRYVHPASYKRYKNNTSKAKSGSSQHPTDDSPAAPWNYDIFKRKVICFGAKNIGHYAMFAALNPGTLVYGDETNKLECGLASFNSIGSRESPLPRETEFLNYIYFLLNVCHAIHSWVFEQDELDTESIKEPPLESIFDSCVKDTKSKKGGFFNVGNMRPESIPSAPHQADSWNCGVYTSLTWTMFVAVERDTPALWREINTLADLDSKIVRPFWDLHENKEDRMVNFRYRMCRLMEYFLSTRLDTNQRSVLAVGRHPLPDDWVFPETRPKRLLLPPWAGGPIPTLYLPADTHSADQLKVLEGHDVQPEGKAETNEVKEIRSEIQEYLILPFVDHTGTCRKNLELYRLAFESWAANPNKARGKNLKRRKGLFTRYFTGTYQERFREYVTNDEIAEDHGVCEECTMIADRNNVCVFCDACVHPVPSCSQFRSGQLTCLECFRSHVSSRPKFVDTTASIFASMEDPANAPPMDDNEEDQKPAAKVVSEAKNKRKSLDLPLHSKSIGKTPNIDFNDTESDEEDQDPGESKDLITTLKTLQIRSEKKARQERRARGKREREIPDEVDVEVLKAARKKQRAARKIEIEKELLVKEARAKEKRAEKEFARSRLGVEERKMEKCLDLLAVSWRKGARRNAIQRAKDELSRIWPETGQTEVTDREVTELVKLRYQPKNEGLGVMMAQYHALQMTSVPGEEEGTMVKKTTLLKRLNPSWINQRFDAKFLAMVRTASTRISSFNKWIYIPVGDAREDDKAPAYLVTNVEVHYTQKNHDTCLYKSVASAMHHLEKKHLASVISSTATQHMYTPVDDQLNNLTYLVQEKDCDVLVTKWMTRQRVEKLKLNMQRSDRCAIVLIPLGGDGGIGHAVTIVGDLIFDSTQTHALRFGKESLDWCCANDHGFDRIFMAIKFSWRKHITFEI